MGVVVPLNGHNRVKSAVHGASAVLSRCNCSSRFQADIGIGDIYQDATNMASILLHQDANGKVLVVRSHSFLMFISTFALRLRLVFRQRSRLTYNYRNHRDLH